MNSLYTRLLAPLLIIWGLGAKLHGQEYQFIKTLDKNLQGWTPYDALTPLQTTDKWKVMDGVLHAITDKAPRENWLMSDKQYGDFIMQFDFKLVQGNSGINFHNFFGKEDIEGPQVDFSHDFPGRIYEYIIKDGKYASHYVSEPHEGMKSSYTPKEWNSMEIRVKGTRVQVDVNDKQVTDYIYPKMKAKGFLAWQLHKNQVKELYVRNVQISEWQEVVSIGVTRKAQAGKRGPWLSTAFSNPDYVTPLEMGVPVFGIDGRKLTGGPMGPSPAILFHK